MRRHVETPTPHLWRLASAYHRLSAPQGPHGHALAEPDARTWAWRGLACTWGVKVLGLSRRPPSPPARVPPRDVFLTAEEPWFSPWLAHRHPPTPTNTSFRTSNSKTQPPPPWRMASRLPSRVPVCLPTDRAGINAEKRRRWRRPISLLLSTRILVQRTAHQCPCACLLRPYPQARRTWPHDNRKETRARFHLPTS